MHSNAEEIVDNDKYVFRRTFSFQYKVNVLISMVSIYFKVSGTEFYLTGEG